jgi:hypothetical protein
MRLRIRRGGCKVSGDSRPYEPPLLEDLDADEPTVTAAGGSPPYTSITLVDSGGKKPIGKRRRRRDKARESAGD